MERSSSRAGSRIDEFVEFDGKAIAVPAGTFGKFVVGKGEDAEELAAEASNALGGDAFGQLPWRSVKEATPAASERPVCAWTDNGCKVIERSKPPTSRFAPTPTPTVAEASAPT